MRQHGSRFPDGVESTIKVGTPVKLTRLRENKAAYSTLEVQSHTSRAWCINHGDLRPDSANLVPLADPRVMYLHELSL